MKSLWITLLPVALTAPLIVAAAGAQPLAITSPDRIDMKEDLSTENPKWKFVAGHWVRRPSDGRQVLAQIAETQPWAVAGWDPWTERPLPEVVHVAYPLDHQDAHVAGLAPRGEYSRRPGGVAPDMNVRKSSVVTGRYCANHRRRR